MQKPAMLAPPHADSLLPALHSAKYGSRPSASASTTLSVSRPSRFFHSSARPSAVALPQATPTEHSPRSGSACAANGTCKHDIHNQSQGTRTDDMRS